MRFLDRSAELARLETADSASAAWFAVLWGRRRVGKSRLLIEWLRRTDGVYYVADQSAAPLQRSYFARAVGARFPGFDQVVYPDWRSLLERMSSQAMAQSWSGPIVVDEFPYLVESDPTLPSVLQNWLDRNAAEAGLKVVISGSSQRMMQGLVLDAAAPLYGRATQIIRLAPLPAGEIGAALGLADAVEMVQAFGVWGGIPRYWELAQPYRGRLDEAVDQLVLDPLGPLHGEPDRLLAQESPPATALRPILDVIGSGAHKVSEIAGRIGRQATSISRPLTRLIEMDLLRRELPFGASEKQTKRSLYRIADPFLRLWFRVVAPNRSILADAPLSSRRRIWARHRDALIARAWEDLARQSIGHLPESLVCGPWLPARRHWHGNEPEFDAVATAESGDAVLLGEVKWGKKPFGVDQLSGVYQQLLAKGLPAPLWKPSAAEKAAARRIVHAVFVPEAALSARERRNLPFAVVTAEDVMDALRAPAKG